MKLESEKVRQRSLSAVLADFICGLSYEDLPNEVREMAKTRLLDNLSSCFAGTQLPCCQKALKVVEDSRGTATIVGQRERYGVRDAAFVNGVLAHSIMQEDSQAEGGHPSTIIVPAALAVAEQKRSSGLEFIVAIVVGYELMKRITLGTPAEGGKEGLLGGFRNSTVFGIFGSTAASGKLMRLKEEQLTNAIGYAASLACGLTEGWAKGTMEYLFQAGAAAQNGILAARAAQAGATASEWSLEGRHGFFLSFAGTLEKINRAVANLGKSFAVMETRRKPYPACGSNQATLAMGQYIRTKYNPTPIEIVKVIERAQTKKKTYPGVDAFPPYKNGIQAQMSSQFCLASALLGRQVHSYKFFYECYGDPEVAELANKIELVGEEERQKRKIEVHLKDGTKYQIEEDPSYMLAPTWENMETKFLQLASNAFSEERTSKIIQLVKTLDRLENIQEFTSWLRPQ